MEISSFMVGIYVHKGLQYVHFEMFGYLPVMPEDREELGHFEQRFDKHD